MDKRKWPLFGKSGAKTFIYDGALGIVGDNAQGPIIL
jgi:hypothetical protein